MSEIIGKIKEVEEGVEWEIGEFLSLQTGRILPFDGAYKSPPFSFASASWKLGIEVWNTENGNGRFIRLFLFRTSPGPPPIHLEISISVRTRDGRKHGEKKKTKVFDWRGDWFYSGDIQLDSHRMGELVPNGTLTVLCTLRNMKGDEDAEAKKITTVERNNACAIQSAVLETSEPCSSKKTDNSNTETPGDTASAKCSYCKRPFYAGNISSHEKKCFNKPVKCPECSEIVPLQNWCDHECHDGNAQGEDSTSGSSSLLKKNKVLLDLKELFLKNENCDVVLNVKGREFPAHKLILAARSPVFESTFRCDMKEKSTGIVDIEDCDPSSFSDFLCYLYCGAVENLSEQNVFSLFAAADKYDVQDLRAECLQFMKENLSVDTFCDTLTLALRHSETELIQLTTDFFTKNAPKIIVTVKWQKFLDENPTESNELFIKLLVPNKN